jgi:hypothetical protein
MPGDEWCDRLLTQRLWHHWPHADVKKLMSNDTYLGLEAKNTARLQGCGAMNP